MQFDAGGHLTHGLKSNFSGRFFNFDFYGVDSDGILNYEQIEEKSQKSHPKLIVCGASSYPRTIDFERLGEIAKKTGSYLMADLSHPAGLIAAKRFPSPFPYCDVVTLTPDKTMLGPHGGIILCKDNIRAEIDKAVHPGVQSSVPLRRIYEMAQCFLDAGTPYFEDYIDRVLKNMGSFEKVFSQVPDFMVTGGSDTHLMVLNTYNTLGLTGRDAEEVLEKVGILTNRQVVPGEKLKPYVASGIRLGTSWITARGYSEDEAELVAVAALENLKDPLNEDLQLNSKEILDALVHLNRDNDVWNE